MSYFKRNPEVPTVYRAMSIDPGPDGRKVMYEFGDGPVLVTGPRDVEKFRNEEVGGVYRLIECDRLGNDINTAARPDLNNPVPRSFHTYTPRGNPVVAQAPVVPDQPAERPVVRSAQAPAPAQTQKPGTNKRVAKKVASATPQPAPQAAAPVSTSSSLPKGPAPTATPPGAGIDIDDDPEVRALKAQRGRSGQE